MKVTLYTLALLLFACSTGGQQEKKLPGLSVSENGRFLMDEDGDPFFWLGDTGWLLFSKLNREEAEIYLEDRARKGFNVIQAMVLPRLDIINVYGDSALIGRDVTLPAETKGNDFEDPVAYDFWDHVDYIISLAENKGIYMALVPVWGSNVRNGGVSREQAGTYATWLAQRYAGRSNIIWMNGGDIRGSDSTAVWEMIGSRIRENDPDHLITFHPFGRTASSMWFHEADWLDFNMFQSGHRRYDQDNTPLNYGEDNFKYVRDDCALIPAKPTLDGEPSYEGIPQGLHDPSQPYWDADDVRRYAYWSVFAGACGFTYGHNAVMQMYKPGDPAPAYGVREYWTEALDAPGAWQMIHLKELILSKPFFERVPDQTLIASGAGERYDHLAATRGKDYAFIYTWNGRDIDVNLGKTEGARIRASWFNPRSGEVTPIGVYENTGTRDFDPPGMVEDGADWVLVLESVCP
jgi:hypothetical protein